ITPNLTSYNLSSTCPTGGTATVLLTGSGQTQNFGFVCAPTLTDYSVSGYASTWRPGFARYLSVITSSNDFCSAVPATVTAYLPSELSYGYTSSGYPAPVVSGNTLSWNVSSLSSAVHLLSYVYLNCANTATLGDTL